MRAYEELGCVLEGGSDLHSRVGWLLVVLYKDPVKLPTGYCISADERASRVWHLGSQGDGTTFPHTSSIISDNVVPDITAKMFRIKGPWLISGRANQDLILQPN